MSFLANCGKAQIYKTDGTGRDTYIFNNSGGFCADKEVAKVAQIGMLFNFYWFRDDDQLEEPEKLLQTLRQHLLKNASLPARRLWERFLHSVSAFY